MKKKIKILTIILGVIFVLPNISNFIKKSSVKFDKIPNKYKNHILLDSLKSTSEYKVSVFENDSHGVMPSILNDSTIYISTYKRIKNNKDEYKSFNGFIQSWHKINNLGVIIDSLTIVGNHITLTDNYLIDLDKNKYSTWLINGDTLQKPFLKVGKGEIFNQHEYNKYTENATFLKYSYKTDSFTNERYKNTVYYKNNKWYEINSKEHSNSITTYHTDNYVKTKNLSDLVTFEYFHKEYWFEPYFPNFTLGGSIVQGSHGPCWLGCGFYNLTAENIKIDLKIAGLESKTGYKTKFPLRTYYHYYTKVPNKFSIITKEDGVGHTKHFLIQKK